MMFFLNKRSSVAAFLSARHPVSFILSKLAHLHVPPWSALSLDEIFLSVVTATYLTQDRRCSFNPINQYDV